MSRTDPTLLGIAAAALLASGGACIAGEPSPSEQGDAPKVVMTAAVEVRPDAIAGATGYLRVLFSMAPDWHIYWRNPGESGSPTKITLTLPDGIAAGPTICPGAERYLAPGDVLDYVHSNETFFFVPLTFATKEAIDAAPKIAVHADWFVCNEDKCVIGSGDATPALKRADTAAGAAWTRIPRPAAPDALTFSWRGGKLALRVAGAASLTFFEDSPSATMPRALNPLRDGAADRDTLVLEFAPETVAPGRVVTGVLTVKDAAGALTHHEIRIPAPGSDNPQGPPKTSDSK